MPAGTPLFTFHALDEGREPYAYPPARFAEWLARLAAAGWRGRPLTELVESLSNGEPVALERYGVTFDDGYRSVYRHALPALVAHGVPATVFVSFGGEASANGDRLSSMLGRERLSWAEMREMAGLGIEFGAHTITHPDLTRLPEREIERQMVDSKRRLEDGLSLPVRSFAYPFGRHDARCREIARRHFDSAVSDRLGFARAGDDRWALPRIETYYLRSPMALSLVGRRTLAPYLAIRNVPRRLRRLWRG